MSHTGFYEALLSYEHHAAHIRQEGHSRTNVSCRLVASSEQSANSLWKDTAGTGICLSCHCGTHCTGWGFSILWNSLWNTGAGISIMQLFLLLTQKFSHIVLKNQSKGDRRRICKCPKDNWPLCALTGRTDSSFMTEAIYLGEDIFWFWFVTMEWLLKRQRCHPRSGINEKNAKVVEWSGRRSRWRIPCLISEHIRGN